MPTLLRAVVVGLVAGCKSLAQLEDLTTDLSGPMRRLLGIGRRIADTTLRDVLARLDIFELRKRLHAVIKAARRRKALEPVYFPFGVGAMDGKRTALPCWDDCYAQRNVHEDTGLAYGLLTTVTTCLVSAQGKPCIDAMPVPADTNEMGHFAAAFESLVNTYGDLIELFTYDAGANSVENARTVVDAGKHYLFRLKDERRFLLQQAMQALEKLPASEAKASTEDVLDNRTVVHRRLYVCKASKGYKNWTHVRTVLRVQSETVKDGQLSAHEDRYYVSSLEHARLTWEQWLSLVRHHWGVENHCHHTFDAIFREDEKPWIEMSPKGALAVLILRRIAYTLLTMFRSRTQRSEERRAVKWRRLLTQVYNALISATAEQLDGMRDREVAAFS